MQATRIKHEIKTFLFFHSFFFYFNAANSKCWGKFLSTWNSMFMVCMCVQSRARFNIDIKMIDVTRNSLNFHKVQWVSRSLNQILFTLHNNMICNTYLNIILSIHALNTLKGSSTILNIFFFFFFFTST